VVGSVNKAATPAVTVDSGSLGIPAVQLLAVTLQQVVDGESSL
jgi:hypothetical protein